MNKQEMIDKIYEVVGTRYYTFSDCVIGDVLEWIEKNTQKTYNCECGIPQNIFDINRLWKDKRKPIEEQSVECITYIYNLIKNGNT